MKMEMPTRQLIKVSLPHGHISEEGKCKISQLLGDRNLPYFNYNGDWVSCVTGKGEYVGSFPKIAAKWYYQEYHIKLNSDLLGKIGSLIGQHAPKKADYHFDFTNDFDWKDGDFGDHGSCFWGCHSETKELMQENGFYAIRFFSTDMSIEDYPDYSQGKARCWIAPKQLVDKTVIFNAYGFNLSTIAQVLAKYWGCHYKHIGLENCGSSTNSFYINKASGIILGDVKSNDITYHDFNIATNVCICGCCEEQVNLNECTTINNERICQECFENFYSYCDDCDSWVKADDSVNTNDDRTICAGCYNESYFECEDCNEVFHRDCANNINDKMICNNCKENYDYCEKCETYTEDELNDTQDGEVCDDCFSKYEKCQVCGEHFKNECSNGCEVATVMSND